MPPIVGDSMHHFSLEDTYMTFDMRDSYLNRQSTPLSNEADAIIISNEDYETKTCNIWRSHDSHRIYASSNENSTALDFYTGVHSISDKVSQLTRLLTISVVGKLPEQIHAVVVLPLR